MLNSEESYIKFINNFPDSPLVEEANISILILNDKKIYAEFIKKYDLNEFYTFIKIYKDNYYINEIKQNY